MAHSPNAGGPPGTTMAGPIHNTTNMGDAAGPVHLRGPMFLTTNASESQGHISGLTPYSFIVDGLNTSESTTLMPVGEAANNVTNYIAPFAGAVVGITGQTDQATAASSSVTVAAQIAGVRLAGTMEQTIAATGSTLSGTTTNLTSFVFAAGATIEAIYVSNSTDTVADLTVTVWTV